MKLDKRIIIASIVFLLIIAMSVTAFALSQSQIDQSKETTCKGTGTCILTGQECGNDCDFDCSQECPKGAGCGQGSAGCPQKSSENCGRGTGMMNGGCGRR